MLYQTHHPLFFQSHPFASSTTPHLSTPSSSSSLPSVPLFPYLPLPQAETEMACVEAALKSSFRKEMAMKFSPQTLFLEELSAFNVVQNVATCDDFFVDDLLDFSHEEALLEEEPQQNHGSASVSPQHENQHQSHEICNLSFNDHFGSVPTSELTFPDEDAADLEWLSHFVEDSFSEYSISFPTVNLTENLKQKAPEPGSPVSARPFFKTPVPAKARSKRSRTGVPVWPLGFPFFTESSSSTSSSTTTTSSSSSSSHSSPLLIYATVAQNLDRVCSETKLPQKKVKRKTKPEGEGCCGAAQAPAPRRCSHCGVQKTPQWRTGPLGAKTLCNACGVRYKSGRLLPEYRPACSPTFSSELHSNHHRKVLEMRRKKEVTGGPETGSVTPPAVPGF